MLVLSIFIFIYIYQGNGSGHSSGMLRVGDILLRVEKEYTAGLRPEDVHRCVGFCEFRCSA